MLKSNNVCGSKLKQQQRKCFNWLISPINLDVLLLNKHYEEMFVCCVLSLSSHTNDQSIFNSVFVKQ